jgi:crotonobetainyl-CoA:carnitine CoA-transferase CaiB-like acyl-CoA transferase
LPLAGLRVVEFTHMVMGPTCGMVLADLGAEVIKVEPVDGDRTRHLLGAGAGFFPMFNRNKKSIALDLRSPEGLEVARKLAASADVVAQNFKPGVMGKYGLDYAALSQVNPRLIYVNHTGFLPGPYEHRTALDEVVQMMGGLAYMTGRPGDPLRAGTSVNDIMGGMFGAIGAMAALMQRGITGRGQEVDSALFREQRVSRGSAHDAVRRHRPARRAHARPHLVLGFVRRVQREGRRADFSGRGERCAVDHLLRRHGLCRPQGRTESCHQQRPRARPPHAAA